MKTLIISLKIFLFFTLLTGIIYPIFVTGIVRLAFPDKANGSLIVRDHKLCGSMLIGQQFDSTVYFSSRPSAVSYNPLPSGASNYGLTNHKLKNAVYERKINFLRVNLLDSLTEIPPEMLFTSASGLDPHISPEAALLQVERISAARHFNIAQKRRLMASVEKFTEKPQYYLFGKERINVLMLNIELDRLTDADDSVL
ncbi:MAG: potassium-transporting ATPase subunit KdpC [Lentimicrobium sp.]